jgi:RimJ/RimL family protein N-acetyltransferase
MKSSLTGRFARRVLMHPLTNWFYSDHHLVVWCFDTGSLANAAPPKRPEAELGWRINHWADLEHFEPTERWHDRADFLRQARDRLNEGQLVFTALRDSRLAHFAWVIPEQRRAWFPYVEQHYDFPPATAVMFNMYTHPDYRGSGLHQASMRLCARHALLNPETRQVYAATEGNNPASWVVANRVGGRCIEVLYQYTRFGHKRRGRISAQAFISKDKAPA